MTTLTGVIINLQIKVDFSSLGAMLDMDAETCEEMWQAGHLEDELNCQFELYEGLAMIADNLSTNAEVVAGYEF